MTSSYRFETFVKLLNTQLMRTNRVRICTPGVMPIQNLYYMWEEILRVWCLSVTNKFIHSLVYSNSSLDIAPLTILDSGAFEPRKCQLTGIN